MKKGQLSIFIIIGIVILFVLGFATYLFTQKSESQMELVYSNLPTINELAVRDIVENCLTTLGHKAVYIMASQGGYLHPKGRLEYGEPGDGLPTQYFAEEAVVPFVYDGKTINLRSFEDWQLYIARYVGQNMPGCVNLSNYESLGYQVLTPNIDLEQINFEWSRAKVNYSSKPVRITSFARNQTQEILIAATYPIQIKGAENTIKLDEYNVNLLLNAQLLSETARKIVLAVSQTPNLKYNLAANCANFSNQAKTINIYSLPSVVDKAQLVQIVDSAPIGQGLAPLRMQIALRNTIVTGVCTG